jgi:hypothetical protein
VQNTACVWSRWALTQMVMIPRLADSSSAEGVAGAGVEEATRSAGVMACTSQASLLTAMGRERRAERVKFDHQIQYTRSHH